MGNDERGLTPPVSIVMVNYNGGALLMEAVRAVLLSSVPVEVVVGDNASMDGSIQALRRELGNDSRLRVVDNRRNLGFARANNLCLKEVSGNYILFLNPDCIVRPDTIRDMLEVMTACPEAGMAGCLIRNPDGSEQAGCRRSDPTPWRTMVQVLYVNRFLPRHRRMRTFVMKDAPLPDGPVPVDAVSGAFMLARREAVEEVGPLDEGYFVHCEDLDWCLRFRDAGWKVLFVPGVEVVHYKGTCSKENPVRVLWHKHRGMARFYRKFFSRRYPWFLMYLVFGAIWVRFLGLAAVNILKLAARRLTGSSSGR